MKFNQNKLKAPAADAINLAGGPAFAQSQKLELVSVLLTSFLDDQYYRKASATAARLRELIAAIEDKMFVAKAALYARREAGMRSVSHLVAGELAHSVKGEAWTKRFYDRVSYRVDDVLEILAYTMAVLQDKRRIQKSLVMPFRFQTALDAIREAHLVQRRQEVIRALGVAVDHSLANVPRFAGRTLIALDGSGSMQGRPMKIGSLFAAVLYWVNEADLLIFSDDAKFVTLNKDDSTLTLADQLAANAKMAGTNFHSVFQTATAPYDRVILLSDMQAWMGHHVPTDSFAAYVKRAGKRPRIYSFDLAGYGSLQFPESGVHALAGFSDKAMETMRFLEQDQSALLHQIEAMEL